MQVNETQVRAQAAQVIAAIALIEIPRGEWAELVPTLCNWVKSDLADGIKLSSMLTIAYLCEDLKPADLQKEHSDNIVQTLVLNMYPEPEKVEFTRIATKAFFYSIPYAKACFANPEDRNFIMQRLVAACALTDEEVQLQGLQCLVELAKEEYAHLVDFIPKIKETTVALSTSQNFKIGAQAFEFWTSLIETESYRAQRGEPTHNILAANKETVLQMIFNGICMIDFDEDDDADEWGTALASASCLQAFA